jgi:hypothetical protein
VIRPARRREGIMTAGVATTPTVRRCRGCRKALCRRNRSGVCTECKGPSRCGFCGQPLRSGSRCGGCRRLLALLRELDAGACREPPPDLGVRLERYAERARLGAPLFTSEAGV